MRRIHVSARGLALALAMLVGACPGQVRPEPPASATPLPPCLGDSDGCQDLAGSGVAFLLDRSTLSGPEDGLDIS